MLLNHRELSVQDSDVVAEALENFRKRTTVDFSDCLVLGIAKPGISLSQRSIATSARWKASSVYDERASVVPRHAWPAPLGQSMQSRVEQVLVLKFGRVAGLLPLHRQQPGRQRLVPLPGKRGDVSENALQLVLGDVARQGNRVETRTADG